MSNKEVDEKIREGIIVKEPIKYVCSKLKI